MSDENIHFSEQVGFQPSCRERLVTLLERLYNTIEPTIVAGVEEMLEQIAEEREQRAAKRRKVADDAFSMSEKWKKPR